MKILVDRKPAGRLGQNVLKYLAKGKPRDLISGHVLTGDEATAKFHRSTTRLRSKHLAQAAVVLISCANVLILALNFGSGLVVAVLLSALVLVLVGVAALWARHCATRLWRERLPDRIAAVAAPGTPVRLDADGISIGSQTTAWSELHIDQLELAISRGEDEPQLVDRVTLTGGGAPITLDTYLIENGGAMVQTACRRVLSIQV